MSATIVQHRVRDYATWKKAFDSVQQARDSSGAVLEHIYRDADDPNKLTVILKWKSLTNARKYMNSPEFKAAISKAGIEGQPSIAYLDEA
jgi:quinol monooxygenase YgiN